GLLAGAPLERDRTLPRSRYEARRVEHRADLGLALEPLQAGAREHDRAQPARRLGELGEARVDVAADRHHIEILTRGTQLGHTADAARRDARATLELVESAGAAQHVLGACARGRAEQLEAAGEL